MTIKVLYVDDNEDDRDAAKRFFVNTQYEIETVTSAEIGFRELVTGKYDIVICDLIMPHKDGRSFAKDLAKSNLEIPLILISGIPELQSFQNYSGLKNYLGFILKPLTPQNLGKLLEKAVK